MNISKKVISIILFVLIVFSLSLPVYAAQDAEAGVLDVSGQTGETENEETAGSQTDGTEKENTEEKESEKEAEGETEREAEEENGSDFNWEKAAGIAVTAAKSKMILEGLTPDITDKAVVTRMTYNKKTGTYKAVIRSGFRHKYICKIATANVLGKTIGHLAESEYKEQNPVRGFFGRIFEKTAFFFIKLFGLLD